MSASVCVVERGVDWITATSRETEQERSLLTLGEHMLREERRLGNDLSGWRFKGFEGETSGAVDVGVRNGLSIVRLRGKAASFDWYDVYERASNVSRLDLQVTLRFEGLEPSRVIRKCHERVKRTKYLGKPQKWHYRQDVENGDTLEVARRVSEKFGRIYDKDRQSRIEFYRQCVRFELELHDDAARWASACLSDGCSVPERALSILQGFFKPRGVTLPLDSANPETISFPRLASDFERRLLWIEKCVRPTVERARALNRLAEVMIALGLETENTEE